MVSATFVDPNSGSQRKVSFRISLVISEHCFALKYEELLYSFVIIFLRAHTACHGIQNFSITYVLKIDPVVAKAKGAPGPRRPRAKP